MGARSSSWTARLAAAVLAAGYALLIVVASATESPLRPPLPAGVGVPALGARTARALGLDGLSRGALVALSLSAVAVAVGAFVLLVREAWNGRASWTLLGAATAAGLVLAIAGPLLLSRDVYSYASYGRMVARYGANPYRTAPAAFPHDVFTPVISRTWVRTRSVYGPVFTVMSALLAKAWFGSTGATVAAFKVVAGLSAAGAAVFGAAATRRLAPGRERAALCLAGANPVIVLHTVGGGHNDALVAFGVALALWVVARREPERRPVVTAVAVTAILTLAALVKVAAAIPLALWLWQLWREGRRTALIHLVVVTGLTAALTAPFATGWRTISALANLASRQGWASPARLVARGAEAAVKPWAGSGIANVLAAVLYVAFLGLAAVLVWRRTRAASTGKGAFAARTWGPALLLFALAAPYLLPWYAAWFLPLVAACGEEALLWIAVAVSGVLALTGIPDEPGTSPALWRDMLLAVHYVAAPVMLSLFAVVVRHELRRRADA